MNKENPSARRRVRLPVLIALLCLTLLLAYGVAVVVRGLGFYKEMMAGGRGNVGKVYDADPSLGFVPAPGIYSFDLVPIGPSVVLHHDDEGLRAPLGVAHSLSGKRPRILFLGDSFTYGRMVAAEDSFAYKTARKLGGESLNGGVNGYGLAQMVRRAEQLIPKYQPDFVVVQYSPWLVTRAMDEFAPAETGSDAWRAVVPVPYYTGRDTLEIAAPAFSAAPEVAQLPGVPYRATPGFSDKLSFLWRIALPLAWYQDTHVFGLRLKQMLGFAKRPTQDTQAVIRQAYARIDEVAAQNQARMILLALGDAAPLEVPGQLFPAGAAGVNGWQALMERLTEPSAEAYARQYMHWRGDPPQLVDWHPNVRAHELLADAIAERIRLLASEAH